jgi:peptide/nickel transport system substrate-binding protein
MALRGFLRSVLTAPLVAGLAIAAIALAAPSSAAGLKWASQEDAATMDPHAFNHGMTLTVLQHIYEGLVRRDAEMHIEPALAASWTNPSPMIWRFKLRDGVIFHDGTPLGVADVVFSIKRAMGPGSDMKVFAATVVDVRPGDEAGTVDIVTGSPTTALLQSLPELRIMSKAWAEKHDALTPADFRKGAENYATRNANGTGPFSLVVREPEVKTVLAANARWWDKPRHNITEATLVKISADATRVAALLSGEVDFAYPIPIQDIDRVNASGKAKVLQGHEIRAMFLAMDLARDELLYSSVKGRNPFKDHRVRQAFYQAIDVDTINARLMRGTAVPMGEVIASGVNAFDPALNRRAHKFDVEAAKRLMQEAGFAGGFQLTLDCPNDRYINSERVCQAVAGMLARIDVKLSVNAMPSSKFFAKIGSRDTSFNFFGYAPSDLDACNALNVIVQSPDGNGNGQWNVGNYSNPEVDAAIRSAQSEMDQQKRQAFVSQASTLHRRDIGHIPLYQPGITWGLRNGITAVLQIDNRVNLAFFRID